MLQKMKQTERYGAEEERVQSCQVRIWLVSNILTFGYCFPFSSLSLANSVPSSKLKSLTCHLGQIYICNITANNAVATSSCGMLWPTRQSVLRDISRAQTVLWFSYHLKSVKSTNVLLLQKQNLTPTKYKSWRAKLFNKDQVVQKNLSFLY